MISRKKNLIWSAFAVCAMLVVGAMLWLTNNTLEAERQRAKAELERRAAETRADLEERTRLALWRIDAAGAAIMLRENRQATQPDPAAESSSPEVLLRFQVRRGEPFRYPSLDAANDPDDTAIRDRIRQFRSLLSAHPLPGGEWQLLNTAAIEGESYWQAVLEEAAPMEKTAAQKKARDLLPQKQQKMELSKSADYQIQSNTIERNQRAKALGQAIDNESVARAAPRPSALKKDQRAGLAFSDLAEQPATKTNAPGASTAKANRQDTPNTASTINPMRPVWIGDQLFLLRQISHSNSPAHDQLQGVWLDWKVLAAQLLAEIPDLLPNARLLPAKDEKAINDPLTLVSFPLRLVRQTRPIPTHPSPSATNLFNLPLSIAWTSVIIALLASMLLTRGIMRLSDRRASFVSAVTHELRTPLTTFRLYADMLEHNAVQEDKRPHYLHVLAREADRLTHLVENVLAFSRIENGGGRTQPIQTTLGDMLESMRERFETRLATADLELQITDASPPIASTPLKTDVASIEHILFNLIDNAAKYAAHSQPPIVEIKLSKSPHHVEIGICDHGPGIPEREKKRIFKAFHKSAHDAAESQPGVGLGLALSLRLAHSLGGSLTCHHTTNGACFSLRLPIPP